VGITTENCNSETAEDAEVRRGDQTAASRILVRLALKAVVSNSLSVISVVGFLDSCERFRRV
jgi:hypothetical protein